MQISFSVSRFIVQTISFTRCKKSQSIIKLSVSNFCVPNIDLPPLHLFTFFNQPHILSPFGRYFNVFLCGRNRLEQQHLKINKKQSEASKWLIWHQSRPDQIRMYCMVSLKDIALQRFFSVVMRRGKCSEKFLKQGYFFFLWDLASINIPM